MRFKVLSVVFAVGGSLLAPAAASAAPPAEDFTRTAPYDGFSQHGTGVADPVTGTFEASAVHEGGSILRTVPNPTSGSVSLWINHALLAQARSLAYVMEADVEVDEGESFGGTPVAWFDGGFAHPDCDDCRADVDTRIVTYAATGSGYTGRIRSVVRVWTADSGIPAGAVTASFSAGASVYVRDFPSAQHASIVVRGTLQSIRAVVVYDDLDLPDLHIVDPVITPTAPEAGNQVMVDAWVTNSGRTLAATNSVDTSSGTAVTTAGCEPAKYDDGVCEVQMLDAGDRVPVRFDLGSFDPGTYEVTLTADPGGYVRESDESNNQTVVSFTVPGPSPTPTPPPSPTPTPTPTPTPSPPPTPTPTPTATPPPTGEAGVDLSPESQSMTVKPTGTATYQIAVRNSGGATDTIDLVATSATSKAWSYTLDTSSVTLAPGADDIVLLRVSAPNGKNSDSLEVLVTGTSRTDPSVADTSTTHTTKTA